MFPLPLHKDVKDVSVWRSHQHPERICSLQYNGSISSRKQTYKQTNNIFNAWGLFNVWSKWTLLNGLDNCASITCHANKLLINQIATFAHLNIEHLKICNTMNHFLNISNQLWRLHGENLCPTYHFCLNIWNFKIHIFSLFSKLVVSQTLSQKSLLQLYLHTPNVARGWSLSFQSSGVVFYLVIILWNFLSILF